MNPNEILPEGAKLPEDAFERVRRPFTLQRIGPRTWWVEAALFQATVVVGDEGVLVIDPLSAGRSEALMAAVREVSDLPLTALAYSHHHLDHIGDAALLVAASGVEEIVATEATARLIGEHELPVPGPTRVLDTPEAHFDFEGLEVRAVTPPSGHTPDNAIYLLPAERVAHNVDMVHPGWIDFDDFGLCQSLDGYERALRSLAGLDGWTTLTAGHGNIGSRDDVAKTLRYLSELRDLTGQALAEVAFPPHVDPGRMPWSWLHGHRDAVVVRVVEGMRPDWGQVPGFDECAESHARRVYWEFSLVWAPAPPP